MSSLKEAIAENAQSPAEVRSDGVSARQHGLRDQIAADRYAAENEVLTNGKTLGIRLVQIRPPGAS